MQHERRAVLLDHLQTNLTTVRFELGFRHRNLERQPVTISHARPSSYRPAAQAPIVEGHTLEGNTLTGAKFNIGQ